MAAILRATPLPVSTPPVTTPKAREPEAAPSLARAYLTRLSQLHDEAAKTALLANLLGRATYAAAVLAAAGVGAAARAYTKAIRAPFELGTLQGFARDLSAILVYAGFAFGAGAILV